MASQAASKNMNSCPKLFGRAFYESIGSPKLILAPMVDHSEFAWRMLTRSFLPLNLSKRFLAYTPMFHSRMFADTPKYRNHHFEPLHSPLSSQIKTSEPSKSTHSDHFLDGNPAFDRPLFVQFCSNSPEDLLEAARIVEPFCDAVDLNLGCPQGIARRGHYGAFLQEDRDLIFSLINKLHRELSIPVTAKMRILDTKEHTLEYAKMILNAGASIITVHGRQREQKGHNTGLADWEVLKYLRVHLPQDTVIFANGNILQHGDIEKCMEATGADGVMSAEANLHDPSVFAPPPAPGEEGREYWRGRDGSGGYRVDAVMRRYMDILYVHVLGLTPPKRRALFIPEDLNDACNRCAADDQYQVELGPTNSKLLPRETCPKKDVPVNLRAVQSHLFHLLRPLVSKHTNIRDQLATCRPGDFSSLEAVLLMVEAAVKQGILEYEALGQGEQEPELCDQKGAENFDESVSSAAAIRRCKRPWWVCQPYIRPLPSEALAKGAMTLSRKDKAKVGLSQ